MDDIQRELDLENKLKNILKNVLTKDVNIKSKNKIQSSEIEIEFRIGSYYSSNSGTYFNTNITEKLFKLLKLKFDKSSLHNVFTKKEELIEDTYIYINGEKVRMSICNNITTYLKKQKLYTIDCKCTNGPFDVRISISREILLDISDYKDDKDSRYKRIKNRTSYIYKNWKYDLTEVTTHNNSLIEKSFEIELEIISTDREDIVKSSFSKLKDISKLCDDENTEFYLYEVL